MLFEILKYGFLVLLSEKFQKNDVIRLYKHFTCRKSEAKELTEVCITDKLSPDFFHFSNI